MAGREARRNDERLYFKFITKYFEGLHNDLFKKAEALFNEAKEKNPTVKDLTKTVQFMAGVTPELPIPRYYKNRQIKKANTTPQMVLQIPLFDVQDLAASTPSVRVPSPPIRVPSPPIRVPSPPIFQQSTVPVRVPDVDCEPLPLLRERVQRPAC